MSAAYSHDFITALVERSRGEGCHGIGNRLREEESLAARLAVEALQTGRDAAFFIEEAGRCRAMRYEFAATGDVLSELNAERLEELRRRTGSARSGASYDGFGGV